MKYQIPSGTIRVIENYAYTVKYALYFEQSTCVYRIKLEDYKKLRETAKQWKCYQCEPTEENLQLQISLYMWDETPYAKTKPIR